MAGLLRSILVLFMLTTLAICAAALVLAAIVAGRDERDRSFLHDNHTVHGITVSAAGFAVITGLIGLAILVTRNLHRRWVTLVWKSFAVISIGMLGAAWGIWALSRRARLTTKLEDTLLGFLVASDGLMMITAVLYTAKTMEEYAVAHK